MDTDSRVVDETPRQIKIERPSPGVADDEYVLSQAL